MNKFFQLLRNLGPGLIFAGAAIGVSHLIQSTKAGATFGYQLLWAVLLANATKYPFFEFGTRYTLATGKSLIAGYKSLGKWVLILFFIASIGSVFTIQSAVTLVTAGILQSLVPIGADAAYWSIILLVGCMGVLLLGKYSSLDKAMKVIVCVLASSTLVAVYLACTADQSIAQQQGVFIENIFSWDKAAHVAVLIGLMGWMPAPIDLSVWNSLWAIEKKKIDASYNLKKALVDFNIGFIGAAVLAIAFLALGAEVMYGSGETFSPKAAAFANQLVEMYTLIMGSWSKWLVYTAVLATMFSTTISCFDAISRVLGTTVGTLYTPKEDKTLEEQSISNASYAIWMGIVLVGSLAIIFFFRGSMIALVQLATILAFLLAPFFAIINYRLVTRASFPQNHKPKAGLLWFSRISFVFLLLFSGYYIYVLLVG